MFSYNFYTRKRAIQKNIQLMLMNMKGTNPRKCIATKHSLKLEYLGIIVKQVESFQVWKLSSCCRSHDLRRCDYAIVDSVMHSQDAPSGTKGLLPQVLAVLPTERSQLSAPYQDCFSWRELLPSTWTVFNKWSMKGQLGTTPKSHSHVNLPVRLAEACPDPHLSSSSPSIQSCFFPVPSPPLVPRAHSEKPPLLSSLSQNLPENPTWTSWCKE